MEKSCLVSLEKSFQFRDDNYSWKLLYNLHSWRFLQIAFLDHNFRPKDVFNYHLSVVLWPGYGKISRHCPRLFRWLQRVSVTAPHSSQLTDLVRRFQVGVCLLCPEEGGGRSRSDCVLMHCDSLLFDRGTRKNVVTLNRTQGQLMSAINWLETLSIGNLPVNFDAHVHGVVCYDRRFFVGLSFTSNVERDTVISASAVQFCRWAFRRKGFLKIFSLARYFVQLSGQPFNKKVSSMFVVLFFHEHRDLQLWPN